MCYAWCQRLYMSYLIFTTIPGDRFHVTEEDIQATCLQWQCREIRPCASPSQTVNPSATSQWAKCKGTEGEQGRQEIHLWETQGCDTNWKQIGCPTLDRVRTVGGIYDVIWRMRQSSSEIKREHSQQRDRQLQKPRGRRGVERLRNTKKADLTRVWENQERNDLRWEVQRTGDRVLQTMKWTLDFVLTEMGSHFTVWNRRIIWNCFLKGTLAAAQRWKWK